ncbi:murA1 [Acrasis kona]|uniref:MurA1 n=1 Tax=Acrasis kona TaxID=1008807 RepID=A0AAW2Z4D7_9EUKA
MSDVNAEPEVKGKRSKASRVVTPNSFETDQHFYQKTINAQVSSVVMNFMHLGNDRIVSRYLHLNPHVNKDVLVQMLNYKPKYFCWSGTDLFNVTNSMGIRKMVLIETNSCPSGQKSFPTLADNDEQGGYRTLLANTFKPLIEEAAKNGTLPEGKLAVVYDKNPMEASGYAAALADIFKEDVLAAEFYDGEASPQVRFHPETKVMQILHKEEWTNIRAAFRYVTQKPWNRLPVISTSTVILNPIICCLTGGRNKLLAAKAYDFLNSEITDSGLRINVPKTIRDVEKKVVPIWVSTMGGFAVVKNPYSNAGQGVWTITNQQELDDFMQTPIEYDNYIVQSLIGNSRWSSSTTQGQMYHVGTVPDRRKDIYVADLRMMIHYNFEVGGFSPLALYARRALSPLQDELGSENSWDVLGTNLSIKVGDNAWDTDIKRLIIADRKDFNKLGLGVDNLIDAYIESVLATVAIDKMACRLTKEDGSFDLDLFASLNKDQALINEVNEFQ